MHINSLTALASGREQLSKRAVDIFDHMHRAGKAMTDRQVMQLLGFQDMNSVRPRITELVAWGKLVGCGDAICSVTGKRVRLTKTREELSGQMFMAI